MALLVLVTGPIQALRAAKSRSSLTPPWERGRLARKRPEERGRAGRPRSQDYGRHVWMGASPGIAY